MLFLSASHARTSPNGASVIQPGATPYLSAYPSPFVQTGSLILTQIGFGSIYYFSEFRN